MKVNINGIDSTLNSTKISRSKRVRTTELGGCIVTLVYTETSFKEIIVTHYPPFSTEKHLNELDFTLNRTVPEYRSAVLLFKRKGSDVDAIISLLTKYCADGIKPIQYPGYNEQAEADVNNRSWKTKNWDGKF